MVSAFCSINGLSLGQVRTEEKFNEITAIPALIEALDLTGYIVAIVAVVADAYFSKSTFVDGALDMGFHVISRFRDDAYFAISPMRSLLVVKDAPSYTMGK